MYVMIETVRNFLTLFTLHFWLVDNVQFTFDQDPNTGVWNWVELGEFLDFNTYDIPLKNPSTFDSSFRQVVQVEQSTVSRFQT
jgi:hypothetical protein